MKPMKVNIGEYAPDVDELLEKANQVDDMLQKVASLRDDSQLRNITGVEEAQMSHYWTNQQQPEENIETMQRQAPTTESVNLINANPHQTGSSLAAHENTAGGEVKKADKKGKMCVSCNKLEKHCGCGNEKMAYSMNKGNTGVRKAGPMPGGKAPPMGAEGADALAALMGAGGDEGAPPDMGGGMGGEVPSDPSGISDMLMELGKKVKALGGGGGGDMPMPDMPMGGDEGAGAGAPPNLQGM